MTSINIPPPPSFTLLVHGRPIHCSRRVIACSSLFMDMVELVDIYPALVGLAGIPEPEGLDGRSLAGEEQTRGIV